MALTAKQEMFAREYLVDLNATQAAIRAGYSAKTAHSSGPRLLENVGVASRIRALQSEREERTNVTQDWVLERLVRLHDKAMEEQPVTDKDGNHVGDRWSTGSVAAKALELMGRHLSMFTDKHEHTGKDGGPMEFDLSGYRERVARKLAQRDADGE